MPIHSRHKQRKFSRKLHVLKYRTTSKHCVCENEEYSSLPPFFKKLKEVILFVCWYAREMPLGSIRLSKIIFNADRLTYSLKFMPMIADAYIRGPQGPYLKELRIAIDALIKERRISVTHKNIGKHTMRVFKVNKSPQIKFLLSDEIECLKRLTETICLDYSAEMVSEASHNSVWKMAKNKEKIPLAAQLVATNIRPTSSHLDWACGDE